MKNGDNCIYFAIPFNITFKITLYQTEKKSVNLLCLEPDMTAHVKKQPMCRIDLLTSIWLKPKQFLLFHEKDMKAFHCMSHLPEVFASRDREKAYYIAGVLVIRGPSYAKFFCLNRVSKFKGPRKSVLHSGRPSYPVYHLSRVYCITEEVRAKSDLENR